jgi:hypothetical protein
MRRRVWIALAVVIIPLVGYPIIVVASGAPRFPSAQECVRPVVDGHPVDVVFGRFDDPNAAVELRDRVVAVGFTGTEMLGDGCGRWKVVLLNVPSVDVARGVQEEATTVDLATTLELGSAA